MTDTKSMRIVPSGKIYRQMFDAQLQLSKSLQKCSYHRKSLPSLNKGNEVYSKDLSLSAPIVHLSREDTGHGLLTSRQRTWVEGFPNDQYTENPVLYKQCKEFVEKKTLGSESSEAGKDVCGLPDVIIPVRTGSDIIQRIAYSRKERHEAAVEEMNQELNVISMQTEPLMEEVSEKTLQLLSEGDVAISLLLNRIETDGDLLTFSLEDLYSLWKEIKHHSPKRREWIKELDSKLRALEDERMNKIGTVFQNYANIFQKISHLLTPDLERFLGKETQAVNQMCLSNRRAYADLFVRLMTADIEREKTQHTLWRRRVEAWKMLKTDLAVQKFKEFMETEEVLKPPGIDQQMELMLKDLESLSARRTDMIKALGDLKPPASTKSAIYKWRQQMQKISQELASISQMQLSKLHGEMEKVCQSCLDQMEAIKMSLLQASVATEAEAKKLAEEKMLPLIGARQEKFEKTLENMETSLENNTKIVDQQMQLLFKYAQGVAHVWDTHEIGLARQERALQEKLEECRHDHDYANQEREANLDIVMDRMRQDATEAALRDSLSKAFEMLEEIRGSYEEFHREQTSIVHTYPEMVLSELENFDKALCTFFSVDRNNPMEKGKEESDRESLKSADQTPSNYSIKEPTRENSREQQAGSPREREASIGRERPRSNPKLLIELPPASRQPSFIVTEVLSTNRGTLFYVLAPASLTIEGEQRNDDTAAQQFTEPTFLTEVKNLQIEEEPLPEYVQSINIPESFVADIKKKMRLNFLNYLEDWCEEAKERAESVVVAKCEELNSELDLRLHLHQPRSRRTELDVHNVRAAELVMHSERVVRHCKGINQSLTELQSRFEAIASRHTKLSQKFRKDIENLEAIFINATKSSRLVKLQNQVGVELEKFMTVIRTSLRQFRQHLDETLQMLRESNARFIKSFKLFSDGGNFCPEEIEVHRKHLEFMSKKIDKSEGSIMSDLEGMESKILDAATKVAKEFEDRFKGHMFDLLFMEKVARWLTNTQVKIKAEVAASNSQAQKLAQYLLDLERRIDACKKPNLDKEKISSAELNEFFLSTIEDFHKRSEYLNCLKIICPPSSPLPVTVSSKVGFANDAQGQAPLTVPSFTRLAKSSDDPSIGIIKNILKTQKVQSPSGLTVFPDDLASQAKTTNAPSPTSTTAPESGGSRINSARSSKRLSVTNLSTETTPQIQKLTSGQMRGLKTSKFEKKMLFGEKEQEEKYIAKEENHFIATIKNILQDTMDGLNSTSEIYYRQKGMRLVTRPQVMQETYDQFIDVVSQKLLCYFQQCEDYHNQCLQEFRGQLTKMEQLSEHIPALVISNLINQHIENAQRAHQQLQDVFLKTLSELRETQKNHENSLRPNLGHPHHASKLEALCEQENLRHNNLIEAIANQRKSLKASAAEHAKSMVQALSQTADQQLKQFDKLLLIDEVEKGRVEPVRYPTSELIRRTNAGEPLQDSEEMEALPRGKGNWLGFPNNQLVVENRPFKIQLTSSVSTEKCTLGHSATVKARDSAYEDYRVQFEKTLSTIEEEMDKLVQAEEHWTNSWKTSVERVKKLYQGK